MNPPSVYAVTKPITQRTSKRTAMVQSISRHLLPSSSDMRYLLNSLLNRTIILPADLRYRLLSETRVAVCLILGPEFVLF
jgi:hypothetical protein